MEKTFTLEDIARRLLGLYSFRYLVLTPDADGKPMAILTSSGRPRYMEDGGTGHWSFMDIRDISGDGIAITGLDNLRLELDLTEYMDSKGCIDYRKCIVDTEEDL